MTIWKQLLKSVRYMDSPPPFPNTVGRIGIDPQKNSWSCHGKPLETEHSFVECVQHWHKGRSRVRRKGLRGELGFTDTGQLADCRYPLTSLHRQMLTSAPVISPFLQRVGTEAIFADCSSIGKKFEISIADKKWVENCPDITSHGVSNWVVHAVCHVVGHSVGHRVYHDSWGRFLYFLGGYQWE